MHYALCIVHFLLSLHPLVTKIIYIANNFQFSILLSLLFDIKVRLQYVLRAHYRKGHWVHSPFTFHTLNYVIFERTPYYSFPVIENLRQQLQHNNTAHATTYISICMFVSHIISQSKFLPKLFENRLRNNRYINI